MAKIFISYRRQDTGQIVASVYNYIAEAFGPESVFIDTKDIHDGAYFRLVIEQNIRDAAVMLVIIGKNWWGMGVDGHRRIDEQDDLVRAEVRLGLELARQGHLTLIPVLVDDTSMPLSQQLPADLSDLHWRNAAQVHSSLVYLTDDINRLLDDINKAGIPRRVTGRIEQPPDRFTYLGGAAFAASTPAQPAQPAPASSPPASSLASSSSAPPRPPASQRPPIQPNVTIKPSSSTAATTGKNILEVLLMLIFELPGLVRGLLILALIVGGIVVVKNAVFPPKLTEHSSCQEFEQASSDQQNQALQQMMTAHGTSSNQLQETRFSVNLYCNVYGPSAPIDGIYNG